MNDPIHTIFSASECPDVSVLQRYFLKRLPEEEMHGVERHLVDCEMCSYALEGLAKMKDPESLERIVAEIPDPATRSRVRLFGLPRRTFWQAAAAILILLIGSGILIRVLTRTETVPTVAMQTSKDEGIPGVSSHPAPAPEVPAPAPEPDKKRLLAAAGTGTTMPVEEQEQKQEPAPSPADAQAVAVIPAEETPVPVQDAGTGTLQVAGLVAEEKAIATESAAPAGQIQPAVMEGVKMARTAVAKDETAVRSQKKAERTDPLKSGMKFFNNGEYLKAAPLFEDAVAKNPEDREAMYYLALTWFRLGEKEKAGYLAKQLVTDPEGEFFIESKTLLDSLGNP